MDPRPEKPACAAPESASARLNDAPEQEGNPATEAFHRLTQDFGELKEYASYYLAAKMDGIKGTFKRIAIYAALGIVGLIAGGAIIATAAGLLIVGLADLLTRLFGGREWLGELVTGIVVLGVIGGGAWFMMKKLLGNWRSLTIKKYEQRKQIQREQFGHNVTDRAAQSVRAGEAQRSRGETAHRG